MRKSTLLVSLDAMFGMVVDAVQLLRSLSLVDSSGFFVFLLGVLVTSIELIENAGSVRNEVEIRPATASMY